MMKNEKFRIAVLGIGGIGGFFGGKLAAYFADSKDVEVIFVARGENANAIKNNSLKIITSEGEQIAKPHLITTEPNEIGKIDLFIICTKAYDLEESIIKYKDCISEKTAILPLLNGVNHAETIKKILPDAEVWNGCVFIVSRLIEAGIVKVESAIRLLQFGSNEGTIEKLEFAENLFKSAGINVVLFDDIEKAVWEKFIFISSLATLTSYLDKNIGGIINSEENTKLLADLIQEVTNLARAGKINVAENIEEFTVNRIKSAPAESTSSMHSDFQKKGKTELETLTGYVVRESKLLNLSASVYEKLYEELKERK